MSQVFEYQDGDVTCRGALFLPEEPFSSPMPLVLVVHDWTGCNDMAKGYAEELADLGYAAVAVDMYGEGRLGASVEEKSALMMPLKENRPAIAKRMNAALDAALKIDNVDASKVAAIGFCFGGLSVLDLARSGAEIQGVVSFHGLLDNDGATTVDSVSSRVLALHGQRDPMVPDEQVLAFQKEMTEANADWQLVSYGMTYHAFMNPEANDPDFGTVYNERTAGRAWEAMQLFLLECFESECDHEH